MQYWNCDYIVSEWVSVIWLIWPRSGCKWIELCHIHMQSSLSGIVGGRWSWRRGAGGRELSIIFPFMEWLNTFHWLSNRWMLGNVTFVPDYYTLNSHNITGATLSDTYGRPTVAYPLSLRRLWHHKTIQCFEPGALFSICSTHIHSKSMVTRCDHFDSTSSCAIGEKWFQFSESIAQFRQIESHSWHSRSGECRHAHTHTNRRTRTTLSLCVTWQPLSVQKFPVKRKCLREREWLRAVCHVARSRLSQDMRTNTSPRQ